MKGVIIYKGKYGATKQYAAWLGEELQMPIFKQDDFSIKDIDNYDIVLIGGSVYAGVWQMRNWLAKNAWCLMNKKLFLFIVCGTKPEEKDTLAKISRDNIPVSMLNSCPVYFLRGRVVINRLSGIDRLMLKLGAWLTKDPAKKKEMLTDFDDVKKDHITGLVIAVQNQQHPMQV